MKKEKKEKNLCLYWTFGSKLRAYVDVDEEDNLAPFKYLKLLVDVDITKPLKGGW